MFDCLFILLFDPFQTISITYRSPMPVKGCKVSANARHLWPSSRDTRDLYSARPALTWDLDVTWFYPRDQWVQGWRPNEITIDVKIDIEILDIETTHANALTSQECCNVPCKQARCIRTYYYGIICYFVPSSKWKHLIVTDIYIDSTLFESFCV